MMQEQCALFLRKRRLYGSASPAVQIGDIRQIFAFSDAVRICHIDYATAFVA